MNSHRFWIRACTDPFGSRIELLPYLGKIVGSPLEEPSLWRIAHAAMLVDESELAVRWLQNAMQRRRARGTQGTGGPGLTALGRAYIDTGRWDEALDVAAEAADLAEANQMEIIAASADVITATVLAMRADSGAARRHADRALVTVDPAECGLVAARARRALGVAALADGSDLQAFTQLRGLFSEDGTPRFQDAKGLKAYAGAAPITRARARPNPSPRRRIKNNRLNAAGYTWAFSALTASPGARARYDRRRDHGDRHAAAQRNLRSK